MSYSVYYKPITSIFWRKIKHVKGDGFVENKNTRWFILSDETRIEVPCDGVVFKFSKERFITIKRDMEKMSGPLSLNQE